MLKISNYYIDDIIFDFNFVKSCDISKCYGECCYNGVYADLTEVEKILSVKDEVKELMDESQDKNYENWFEEITEDKDFESGYCRGTKIYNNKCVFLDKIGFCTLQKLALKKNIDKWYFKPKYCILYPLTLVNNTLTVDTENLESHYNCNNFSSQKISIIDTFENEIKYLLGEKGFDELIHYKNEKLKITENLI